MAGRDIARRGQQVVTPGGGDALTSLSGELDRDDKLLIKRMAIAKQFPRDDEEARRRLALLAPAKTDEWGYSWPVKNKKSGKTELVEGPSIKCANAVIEVTDNIDVRVRTVDTEDAWIFEAMVFDLERNRVAVRAYRQRRDQVIMGDAGRNDDILFAMGQSKAIRNAVMNYRQDMVDFAWQESRKSLLKLIMKDEGFDPESGKKVDKAPPHKFRERIHQRLEALQVPVERVVQWIGRGEKKWTVEDLARITGVLTAIVDGVISADQMWPDRTSAPPAPPPPPPQQRQQAPPPAEIPDGPPGPDGDLPE